MQWFRLGIVFLVLASNIHWEWTPNGYLAGIIAVLVAYTITSLIRGTYRLASGLARSSWTRRRRDISPRVIGKSWLPK